MRRLFIIRKDLHLSPGKLAAMIAHASELWWINLVKRNMTSHGLMSRSDGANTDYRVVFDINREIVDKYIYGIYTKTICEAKNYDHLMKIIDLINEHNKNLWLIDNWIEDRDYGFINDKCLTELIPENTDGTTTVGIWFKPLDDVTSHWLSKKYKLYKE